jgi:hypothetical protein
VSHLISELERRADDADASALRHTCRVRLTDFWQRLEQVFGTGYAHSVANDQVLTELGGRTIEEALAAGEETVVVWRAVVAAYPERVPARLR